MAAVVKALTILYSWQYFLWLYAQIGKTLQSRVLFLYYTRLCFFLAGPLRPSSDKFSISENLHRNTFRL